MNFAPLEAIANTVLFEGYMLYPYRPSSIKNRQRWNFGTLYPRDFAQRLNSPERWQFSAQILMEAEPSAALTARVRFLQLLPQEKQDTQTWEQGFPRSRTVERIPLVDICNGIDYILDLTSLAADELPAAPPGFRDRSRISRLLLSAECLRDGLYRLSATLTNESPAPQSATSRRAVQDAAFTSAHLLLGLENGAFVSLLDPPPHLDAEAKACVQDGVFPVLAGDPGGRSHVFCSPIILYDYPQVAAESPGDFFDSTEMDELLALRVLTLTDEEKAEMRLADPYARALLERTESLPNERQINLHGAVRDLRGVADGRTATPEPPAPEPWNPFAEAPSLESVRVFGVDLREGDRVRLWPQKKADILDMATEGKTAIIEAIEQDLEGHVHFAVVLEDDPGRDIGMMRQVGHRFFYTPEEVEPLPLEAS